jgi:acetylornithine deacetylase
MTAHAMSGQAMTQLKSDAIELLKQMIATPSISRQEDAIAALFVSKMESFGLKPHRHLNNVWAITPQFDPAKPTLLLNSHLDTVKPNSGYTIDPYQPTVSDGKLFGLGSNDAGGCVVALMAAFRYFYAQAQAGQSLSHNMIYAATAEEEITGHNGIEAMLPHWREQNIRPEAAIVGEPTGMQLAVAEKGLIVLDCTAIGRSGHAARDEGDNAIYKALKDIEWFRDYRFERVSPLLGPNKMTVTMIESGTQHNVVPRECKFTVDMRLNELYDSEQVVQEIQKQVGSQVKPRGFRLRSTSISLEHPLVQSGIRLGRKPYGSPTTSDKGLMPFPALKMGPGESERSHTANEFILLNEIETGIDLYIDLLRPILLKAESST